LISGFGDIVYTGGGRTFRSALGKLRLSGAWREPQGLISTGKHGEGLFQGLTGAGFFAQKSKKGLGLGQTTLACGAFKQGLLLRGTGKA
jgi:hypothetical protein